MAPTTRVTIVGLLTMCLFGLFGWMLAGPADASESGMAKLHTSTSAAQVTQDAPSAVSIEPNSLTNQTYISWAAPKMHTTDITAYTVRLGETTVGQTALYLDDIQKAVTVDNSQLTAGGYVTVSATLGAAGETPRSEGVLVSSCPPPYACDPKTGKKLGTTPGPAASVLEKYTAANPTSSTQTAPTAPTGDTGTLFGGIISVPNGIGPKQNPDALHTYGNHDGITTTIDTYGTWDVLGKIFGGLANGLWQGKVFLAMGGIGLLLVMLTGGTYLGLSLATLSIVRAFGASNLYVYLLSAALIGYGAWAAHKIGKDNSRVLRASWWTMFFVGAAALFLTFATNLVPQIVKSPATATAFGIVAIDDWSSTGYTVDSLHLVARGTYDPTPGSADSALSQKVMENANNNFLNDTYPWFCLMNLGSVDKSTSVVIPDTAEVPGWHGYTVCEWLLKAQTEHNSAALNYLRSDPGSGWLEKNQPDMWDFYQGHQYWKRLLYATIAFFDELIMSPINWGLGPLVGIVCIGMALGVIGLLILLGAAIFPDFQPTVLRALLSLAYWVIFPGILISGVLMALKLLSAALDGLGTGGWLAASSIRAVVSLFIVVVLVIKLLAWRKRRQRKNEAEDIAVDMENYSAPEYTPGVSKAPAAPEPHSVSTPQPRYPDDTARVREYAYAGY